MSRQIKELSYNTNIKQGVIVSLKQKLRNDFV